MAEIHYLKQMSRLQLIVIFTLIGLMPLIGYCQQSKEQLAQYYFNNGEFKQAIEVAEPLYKKTSNKYYYQMLYRSYVGLENYKEAERLVDSRMRKNPNELYLHVDLGKLYAARNDNKKKQKSYDEALGKLKYDLYIISALIWTVLGVLYLSLLKYNFWLVFAIGIPLQLAAILSFTFRRAK